MLIFEFRVLLPMTTEEYQVGQLFSVAETSKNETGGGDGIEVLINEPFKSEKGIQPPGMPGNFTEGQYTHKIYHISKKVPRFLRMVAPKGSLEVTEKAWNAYPYCKTVLSNPGYMKDNFELSITSMHVDNDQGLQENVHGLTKEELAKRQIVYIDISRHPHQLSNRNDYKAHEDPLKFHSEKTGRGPLVGPEWWKLMKNHGMPVMCAYKLVRVHFKWFGLQTRVEKMVQNQEERIFTNFHRQVFCWMDKWHGLTMDDIRQIEEKVKKELDDQIKHGSVRGTCAEGD